MLTYFPTPYPNELLYSVLARYHFYMGNIDCKDTLEELFGSRTVIPSIYIGSHLAVLSEKLQGQLSVEELLSKHTIYSFYSPFLTSEKQKEILKHVSYDGMGLYTSLGMVAGSICKKDGLFYCVECVKEDVEKYGEAYFHREHHLQGINYCPHHEIQINQYIVHPNSISRNEFIRLDIEKVELNTSNEKDEFAWIKIKLSKLAYELLQEPINHLNIKDVSLRYQNMFRKLNLVTASNRVRQRELHELFLSKVNKDLLLNLESNVVYEDEWNWLKILTRNSRSYVHPLRHLLMLLFFDLKWSEFIGHSIDTGPFGTGPFPCLNKVTNHYKELLINTVSITRDFKTNAPIGTFLCLSCGFTYARKGPDTKPKDLFKIGRIKEFGPVWKARLDELNKKNLSIRAIAKELCVDSKTIKRFLNSDVEITNIKSNDSTNLQEQYISDIKMVFNNNPSLTRTELRNKCSKQYMYLYRKDKMLLNQLLPSKTEKVKPKSIVDWQQRDRFYVEKIEKLCSELLLLEKPIRITKSLVGKRLGISASLDYNIDKLPKTKALLDMKVETIEEFQLRRCKIIIQSLIDNEKPIIWWKIQREAGIRAKIFKDIKDNLERDLIKRENDYGG